METPLTYESAYSELRKIASEIEEESVSVDALAEKVKRASELIQFCQSRLRATEQEVNKILKQMEMKKGAGE
ncbi:MAG: exodeoxyribonuclease VII small subunit [Bacteroidetes bacterium]|nr:exodeoxyribonuclease VII small subunit [Bacteroidota bacterium]MBL0065169.1 exodeoxyribonuclease VII small subunit [Bacteroidota bacterium]MBL0138436.1 exodeoxyribonuclease VII small subunit [Bacteroidota bacterium]